MSRFLARRPPPTPSERWAAARAGDYRAVVGAGNVVPSMSTPPDRRAAAGTAGTEADAGADDLVALVAEGDALLAKMERVHSSADATRALHPTEQPMPQTVVPGSEASIAHVHSHGHASSYDTHGSGGSHGHQHTHLDGTSHDHPHLHDHEHHDLHAHPETLFHPDHLVRAGGGGAGGGMGHEHSHTHLHSHTHTYRAGQPTDSRLVSAEELRAPFGLKADALAQGKKVLTGVVDMGQLNTYQVPPPSPAMTVTGQTVGHQSLFNTEDANALQFGVPPAAGQTLDIAATPSDDVTLDPADFHVGGHTGPSAYLTQEQNMPASSITPPQAERLCGLVTDSTISPKQADEVVATITRAAAVQASATHSSADATKNKVFATPKNSRPSPVAYTGIVPTSAIVRPPAPQGPAHQSTDQQTPPVADSWSRPTAALPNKQHDAYGGDLRPLLRSSPPLSPAEGERIRRAALAGDERAQLFLTGVMAGKRQLLGAQQETRRAAMPRTESESRQAAGVPYDLAERQNKVAQYRQRVERDQQVQCAGAIAEAAVERWDHREPYDQYAQRKALARGTAEARALVAASTTR